MILSHRSYSFAFLSKLVFLHVLKLKNIKRKNCNDILDAADNFKFLSKMEISYKKANDEDGFIDKYGKLLIIKYDKISYIYKLRNCSIEIISNRKACSFLS